MAADPKSALNGARSKFNPAQPWRIEDSLDLYNVRAWGKGYFGINSGGHVVVRPDTTERHEIDLYEVVEGLQARDLTTPVVVRFSDILAHRLRRLPRPQPAADAVREDGRRPGRGRCQHRCGQGRGRVAPTGP